MLIVADSISAEHRSWNMSQIKSKDTTVEIKVRKYLFSQGFRYRKNVKTLPGKPDIVLPKYKTIIFIHGCFWHRHEGCKRATIPKSNLDYWEKKFKRNVENDILHTEQLKKQGWKVIVLWECEINKNFEETMERLISVLKQSEE